MSREAIRQAFKTAVESVFNGPVNTTREIDARTAAEYVNIFIDNGTTERTMTSSQTRATLTISYYKRSATDEELDLVGQSLEAAILISDEVKQAVKRPLPLGFSYEDGKPMLHQDYQILF